MTRASTLPPPPPLRAPGSLVWPLDHVPRWRRMGIGEQRPARAAVPTRHHAGIDLAARRGDVVYALHGGTVIGSFDWPRRGSTAAALLVSDELTTTLYGAVEPRSWEGFGVELGHKVAAGQPLATVGIYPGGSTMLHLSIHESGTRSPARWKYGQPPPADLYDVRPYLEAAELGEGPPIEVPVRPAPRRPPTPSEPRAPSEPPPPTVPAVWTPPAPTRPPTGQPSTGAPVGAGAVVIFALVAYALHEEGWL